MKAVTYVRVSSEEQAERGTSIPAQAKALRRWAQAEGIKILQEFADEGASAYAPAGNRPGFSTMISFCKKEDVDLILVHKLDRFSRNREESILFKGLLKRYGVSVKSITEAFDPTTPSGFLYEGMIETINQFYSMNLATETLKGMRENAERGFLNGGALPYGYRRESVNDGGRIRQKLALGDSEHVNVVRDIFRLAVEERKGCRSISQELNRRNIPSPRGGQWSPSTINGLLKNPAYCGDLVWRRRKTKNRTQREVTPREEQIVVRDAHPAIVSRATWEERQSIAKSRPFRAKRSKSKASPWMLGRMIKCSICGGTYVGRKQGKRLANGEMNYHHYYVCHTRHAKKTCKAPIIRADWLEGEVIKVLRSMVGSSETLEMLGSQIRQRIAERRRILSKGDTAKAELGRLQAKIERYWTAIGEGLDPARAKTMIERAEKERSRLEEEIQIAADASSHEEALAHALDKATKIGELFGELWAGMSHERRRKAMQSAIEAISIGDKEVNIRLKGFVEDIELDLSGAVVNVEGSGEPFHTAHEPQKRGW